MIFKWFKVINRTEFLATGLVSREVPIILEGIGLKTFLVTVGNQFSISVDDVFLPVKCGAKNPFVFSNRAVFIDEQNDVWYGVPVS